jgi:hypothetical protein
MRDRVVIDELAKGKSMDKILRKEWFWATEVAAGRLNS